jgi:hypothetical protein
VRYHGSAPVFYLGHDFLERFLRRAGGGLEYGAAFAAQADSQAWLGAGLFAALVGLVCWGTRRCLRQLGCRLPVVHYLPGLALLVLYGRYAAPVLEMGGGVLLSVWSLSAWLAWPRAPVWARWLAFWGWSCALLYVAGLMPFLLLVVLGVGCEALGRRGFLTAAGCSLALALLPWGASWSPETPLTTAIQRWGQGAPLAAAITLYFLLIAIVLIGAGWFARFPRGEKSSPPEKGKPSSPAATQAGPEADLGPGWLWLGFAAAAMLALVLAVDPRRRLYQIQWAADGQRWGTVLQAAAKLDGYPASARLQVNRALFHTGRLGSELFAFPQVSGTDLLPSFEAGLDVCPALSDTLLELGQVNLAEHYAHEALETQGERPQHLRRLARINILKSRPRAARVFLGRLGKVPWQRAWAEQQLRALATDPLLAADPDLARLRAAPVKTDITEMRFPTLTVLQQAVPAGGTNRMAFEYLMAHFLLNRQLESVVGNLGLFKELGYPELPRHVAEASLMHQQIQGATAFDRRDGQVRPEIVDRFLRYLQQARASPGPATRAERALAGEFGDTFWYYAQFGRTPGRPSSRRWAVPATTPAPRPGNPR